MAPKIPTYIPSPNWDIPSDSDIVVLGRLIKDPSDPQSKISVSADPITPPKIYEGEKTDWKATLDQMRSGRIGLWAKCLQLAGELLSFSQLQSSIENHEFTVLETKYFLPDDEYFTQAVEDAGVQAYFMVHNQRKPVYMITGIKIARGASLNTETRTESSAKAEVKVDATTLVEIKPKRRAMEYSMDNFVKGALFGIEDEGEDTLKKVRDIFDISEVDVGFPDTWEQVGQNDV
ncbi:hypothetical protein F4810DRAFT_717917 [Camillea tinctor]|nr:hypothetical protein F4810DRAFT_717917 [Camillea tinctor]